METHHISLAPWFQIVIDGAVMQLTFVALWLSKTTTARYVFLSIVGEFQMMKRLQHTGRVITSFRLIRSNFIAQ